MVNAVALNANRVIPPQSRTVVFLNVKKNPKKNCAISKASKEGCHALSLRMRALLREQTLHGWTYLISSVLLYGSLDISALVFDLLDVFETDRLDHLSSRSRRVSVQ